MGNRVTSSEENGVPQPSLLEAILDRDNLSQAWKRVRANKGAPGMDGMSIEEFPAFARSQMSRIIEWIRQGRYKPAPVKRVWIPKPDGTQRPLGVPTVLDRVIQQAIAQVLGPLFEVDFSESSFGFRPGRRAKTAVERISTAAGQGYKWGVDCDLKSYFDTVNHDLLMHWLSRKVRDKMVLRLIGKYLRAGVRHEDGSTEETSQGVPQGGPLSPLLANIMLDPLDKKIEAMGLPFARYADDFLIVTETKAEALVAMEAVKDYVEGRLKLIVNQDRARWLPSGSVTSSDSISGENGSAERTRPRSGSSSVSRRSPPAVAASPCANASENCKTTVGVGSIISNSGSPMRRFVNGISGYGGGYACAIGKTGKCHANAGGCSFVWAWTRRRSRKHPDPVKATGV